MKKIFLPVMLFVAMALSLTSCNNTATPKLENTQDTLSWAMGRSLAEGLVQNGGIDFNNEVVIAAIQSTLEGKEQPLDDSVYNMAVQYLQMSMMMQQRQEAQQKTKNVKQDEDVYFERLEAENPNIKKTKSGIRYEVMKAGKGPNIKYGEIAVFDYNAYNMLTGEKTDQTYGKHDPIQHVVGSPMFEGLIEGLQLMNEGSQYRFYFPNRLAFGAQGTKNIPPYTPVVYEIELHEITGR